MCIAGTATGIAGGATSLGSSITSGILLKNKIDQVVKLLNEDKNASIELDILYESKRLNNLINVGAGVSIVYTSLRLADAASDLANISTNVTLTALPLISRTLTIGFGIVSIAIDLISLINSTINLHQGSPSSTVKKLGSIIIDLEKNKNEVIEELQFLVFDSKM